MLLVFIKHKATVSVTLNTEEERFTETSESSSATWQRKNPKEDHQLIDYRHDSLKNYTCEQIVIIMKFLLILGRPRLRWEDNIKMDIQEVGGGCGDWMELAQDRDRWRALVSTVLNLRVP